MITNEQLYQLAKDYSEGKVFSNLQIKDGDERLMLIIFMPLALSTTDLSDGTYCLVYEYLDKSNTKRGINGYPTFSSCNFLTKEEFKIFRDYTNKIIAKNKTIKEEILNDNND